MVIIRKAGPAPGGTAALAPASGSTQLEARFGKKPQQRCRGPCCPGVLTPACGDVGGAGRSSPRRCDRAREGVKLLLGRVLAHLRLGLVDNLGWIL